MEMRPQPILFNDTQCENICLSRDKSKVARLVDYLPTLCFTDRPLALNERLRVTVIAVSGARSAEFWLGLTLQNPLTIEILSWFRNLIRRPGFWGELVPEPYAQRNQSFCIYYNEQGEMMLELPDGRSEVFLSGLDVSRPLYAFFDIYGRPKAIQIGVVEPQAVAAGGSGSTTQAAQTGTRTFASCTLQPCEFIPSNKVVKTNGRYATKSSPEGCGIAVTQRSIAARGAFIISVGKFHDRLKSAVRFALTSEAAPDVASLDSIEELFDSTDYTVTFCTEMVESSELAVTIGENGDVFESLDSESWKFLGHVDKNVPFHLVVEMSAMKDLEILGTTSDILRIMPDYSRMTMVRTAGHIDGDRVCIVCLEGDRSMLLEPCLHFVLCGACSEALRGNNCPLCRTPIRRVRRIYMG